MSYKTILAYLGDTRRAEAILEPATHLAGRNNARLIGMHVYAGVPAPPVPLPYGSDVVKAVAAAQQRETEEIAGIFSRMTANRPFVAEWRAENTTCGGDLARSRVLRNYRNDLNNARPSTHR